jgi:hypothetical protein
VAKLIRQLLDRAATRQFLEAVTHSGPAYQTPARPRRGDQVEAWLKAHRDQRATKTDEWVVIDELLDDYRLHADTGTPLGQHVCEQHCDCQEG